MWQEIHQVVAKSFEYKEKLSRLLTLEKKCKSRKNGKIRMISRYIGSIYVALTVV